MDRLQAGIVLKAPAMRASLLAAALFAATSAAAAALSPPPMPAAATEAAPQPLSSVPMTAAARALLAAEDIRFDAELHHNAATLDRMIASDVVYSHFNGQREDKASLMRSFIRLPFTAITPQDRYARVVGDVGIVRGKVLRQLPGHTLTDGYLAVYVRRDGRWQLLEWVTAALPPAADH